MNFVSSIGYTVIEELSEREDNLVLERLSKTIIICP
jgi:hypothetical protein